jgi:DNA-binding NarL/FixJ family response regulator
LLGVCQIDSIRFAWAPCLVEERLERAVEAKQLLAVSGADRFPVRSGPGTALLRRTAARARATTEARARLTAALEIFEGLDAKPWATRAASELRATGRALRRDGDSLTPQELEIAAAGLSNKQIGQRLFLSHRTVGAHLYQIFS